LIKHVLQAVGIVAMLIVFVAFSIIAVYFSYIIGIGLFIATLIFIVTYSLELLDS